MIDTHETVKEIQAAGAEERLAEAIVRAISKAEERAATAEDIQSLEKRFDETEKHFDEKLAALEERFDEKLAALEARLTNKIYAVGAAVIAVMAAFNLIG